MQKLNKQLNKQTYYRSNKQKSWLYYNDMLRAVDKNHPSNKIIYRCRNEIMNTS